MHKAQTYDYDFLIIGSGFGGSVAAHRLTQKGYKVLVVEKGKRWKSEDFPETNWKLRKWLWLPLFGFRGFFKITIMRHSGILSGVGVGGGSLTYANTLPRPRNTFFDTGSWAGMADWEKELEPHYKEAERMLGATENTGLYDSDETLRTLADRFGKSAEFEATRVAVYFGEPEEEVPDPFFEGEGPRRSGCNHCGGCMTGCRYNAKNTLDKNYLYLAEQAGAEVLPSYKVVSLEALEQGEKGYIVVARSHGRLIPKRRNITAGAVVLSGGVLGTVRLLLNLKRSKLKDLSPELGKGIRTNNESLSLVHSRQKDKDFSKGVAIGSIFPVDEDTHLEAVRYASGSGFWKTMGVPLVHGRTMIGRIGKIILAWLKNPLQPFRMLFSKDFAKESVILLFMQHLDSTLQFKKGLINLRSKLSTGPAPSAAMPLAKKLSEECSDLVQGAPFVMSTEALLGTPLTAHILGGCVIGEGPEKGVIDSRHRVHGYQGLFVCDGSAISANPGVNPALTITAMSERAMSFIPEKEEAQK